MPSALALAPDFCPEVVLCDVTVGGGVAGYDFARTVAAHATLRDARLIAVTSQGLGGDRERALAAGFDEELSRPVDVDRLETCLFAAGSSGEPLTLAIGVGALCIGISRQGAKETAKSAKGIRDLLGALGGFLGALA